MRLALAMMLMAAAAAAQTNPPAVPTTPRTVTPEDAPLPVRNAKGAASELEGVGTTEDGVMSLGKYAGGSWSIKPNRVAAYVNRKEIVLRQGKLRYAIPVKSVTDLVYGSAAQTRADVKNAAAGGPTDVAILWTAGSAKNAVAIKLDKGDFTNCMNALETVTGLKAVRADR